MKRYKLFFEGMYEEAQGAYVKYAEISCENCKRRDDCVYREYGIEACSKCEPEGAK